MVHPRYARASRFAPLGDAGQARIESSSVLICGCGALGSMLAERLARSGVGRLRIVDRDWVEETNLQRQTLFTEQHARESTPKAVAAAEVLQGINHLVTVEPIVEDITFRNIETLASGVDLILDGTDNFETRFLINDLACARSIPWVHGGVIGASGQVMSILPGETACFRCLVPELPSRDILPTCDTAGVLAPAVGIIASFQAAEALKILSGHREAASRDLLVIDSWHTSVRQVSTANLRMQQSCPTCFLGQYPFLAGEVRTETTVLCGKNAVQIDPPAGGAGPNLAALAARLQESFLVTVNAFLLRVEISDHRLTLFRDGRVIVDGTTDPIVAKAVATRVLGS